jgi:hypothetical protein
MANSTGFEHENPASITFPLASYFAQSFVIVVPVECCIFGPLPWLSFTNGPEFRNMLVGLTVPG